MSDRVDSAIEPHPEDGVLLAIHDGELGPALRASREHVERCGGCRMRLAAIAERSDRVRTSLATIEVTRVLEADFRRRLADSRRPPRAPAWRRHSWQIAAAVLIVAGLAAASTIRRWFGPSVQTPMTTDPTSRSVQPVPAPQVVAPVGATVSFAPTGAEFTVRFDSLPDDGTLTARPSGDTDVTARIVSGAGTGGDALVVLPGELRVRNATSSRASYSLTLPTTVMRLRVVVGGRRVFDGAPPLELQLHAPR